MGTEPPSGASDPVSPPAEEVMPHQPVEAVALPPELEQAVQQVLAAQPGLPIPPAVLARITGAILAEAETRAALAGNDAEPMAPGPHFIKNPEPAREPEELT